jgi:3-(methylthio)propanoyl-CoA dehydrogenase
MAGTIGELEATGNQELQVIGKSLQGGTLALQMATEWLLATYDRDPASAAASAVPYLMLFGTVAGGWLLARAALVATTRLASADEDFYQAKRITTQFYSEHVLPGGASDSPSCLIFLDD